MRGDGVVEDVDGDCLPQDGELLVMMMTMISPSGMEVPPAESLHRAKVLLPKFHLETAALCPESPPYFFLGQNDLYTKRRAPEVGWAEHNPPGRAWGVRNPLVSCAHEVAPLVVIPLVFFYIPKQFSVTFQLIWSCAE